MRASIHRLAHEGWGAVSEIEDAGPLAGFSKRLGGPPGILRLPRPLDGAVGERLELSEYYADFLDIRTRSTEFWKLERGQVYAEPDDEGWRAFDRGDWDEALRLNEERRAGLADSHREDAAHGLASHRVRIVSLPPSDYLQWELDLLRIRDEAGHTVRVLLDSAVADLEDNGPLPDLNLLGTDVMYQIVYDGNGVLDHAIRYTDEALVLRWRDFVVGLFGRGEPMSAFFQREIAWLPAPIRGRQAIRHDYFEHAGRPQPPRSL
jgi:hypothetical protein